MSLSLYVHIPFCLKRCVYCDFVSGIYDPQKESAYIKALKKEILNIPDKIPFSTLYIGGGTPTALSTHTLSDLIRYIFKRFHFTEDYEATIEANPGTLDKEKLQTISASGINRISIGIQSFNDKELGCLGRLHSSDEAIQSVYIANDTGFENIGIDLIYGIPGQSIESWKKTLEKADRLEAEHISTYELTVEQGTELYDYMNNLPSGSSRFDFTKRGLPASDGADCDQGQGGIIGEKVGFVREERIIEMYSYAIDYLESKGFIHYEISNFAMPDYFCRHNINYWNRGEYYGVGLGAHSFVKGKRFNNTDNLNDYIVSLSENETPVKEIEDITEDMALSEAIFLGLRKIEGINLNDLSRIFGKDILKRYQGELDVLQEAGLIELNSSALLNSLSRSYSNHKTDFSIRLTRKGLLLSNEVFTRFM